MAYSEIIYCGCSALSYVLIFFFFQGASSLGSVFRSTDDSESIRVVHTALKKGVNLIDVAPWYGHGKAETVLGNVYGLRKAAFQLGPWPFNTHWRSFMARVWPCERLLRIVIFCNGGITVRCLIIEFVVRIYWSALSHLFGLFSRSHSILHLHCLRMIMSATFSSRTDWVLPFECIGVS